VEVMLAVEAADRLNGAAKSESCANCRYQGLGLKEGLGAGNGEVKECDMAVRGVLEGSGGGGEEFVGGVKLGVDLDTDGQFPTGYGLVVGVLFLLVSRGLERLVLVLELLAEWDSRCRCWRCCGCCCCMRSVDKGAICDGHALCSERCPGAKTAPASNAARQQIPAELGSRDAAHGGLFSPEDVPGSPACIALRNP
jgi:hypothetical protein